MDITHARRRAAMAALMLGTFAVGTTEFIVAGLLENIRTDVAVTLPVAGLLVAAYAVSVAIGGPVLTVATLRVPRKTLLIAAVVVFCIAQALAATAPGFGVLVLARVLSGLVHGVFVGAAVIVATRVSPPGRGGAAIALLVSSLAAANVLGVPLGTLVGSHVGWRLTFGVMALLGVGTVVAVVVCVPTIAGDSVRSMSVQVAALFRRPVLVALALSVLSTGGTYVLLTYVSPILLGVTGLDATGVVVVLFLFGVGMLLGGLLGGRLADRGPYRSLVVLLPLTAGTLAASTVSMGNPVTATIVLFCIGALSGATLPCVQLAVLQAASDGADLASTINVSALNVGIAIGSVVGGAAVSSSLGSTSTGWIGAIFPLVGAAVVGLVLRESRRRREPANYQSPGL